MVILTMMNTMTAVVVVAVAVIVAALVTAGMLPSRRLINFQSIYRYERSF